jgi:plastocyanin
VRGQEARLDYHNLVRSVSLGPGQSSLREYQRLGGVLVRRSSQPAKETDMHWHKRLLIPAVAVVALAATSAAAFGAADGRMPASAASAPKIVKGTVGPGFTIRLTLGGKKVTRLKARTPYRFVINDPSSIHDFHLIGPGLSRVFTTVDFTGMKSVVLKLKKGAYRYVCDPHASFMRGAFRVV